MYQDAGLERLEFHAADETSSRSRSLAASTTRAEANPSTFRAITS
jgi:hypothetical protein